ncbi:hypothetical protein DXG03_004494 [Asterophora parasitica]|uniref:Uncharacterized protein n=1 Tax=Asterophora parasitica TaxID=117018 RepID=A0A9P7GA51_9AGAR|nr:hypothetical protein DXG03_004494 [Asterophora parasitica]
MVGLSAGSLIGPPVGGALYSHFGYRGPFVFGMGATFIDLVARLLIIERKDSLKWGVDPKELKNGATEENNASATVTAHPLQHEPGLQDVKVEDTNNKGKSS